MLCFFHSEHFHLKSGRNYSEDDSRQTLRSGRSNQSADNSDLRKGGELAGLIESDSNYEL